MTRSCDECGKPYEARRSTSRFCSSSCRVRAHGDRPRVVSVPTASLPGNAVAVARAQLEEAGRLDTPEGVAALALGALLDAGVQSGAASIAREYRAAMADALGDVALKSHPADELLARRNRRRA